MSAVGHRDVDLPGRHVSRPNGGHNIVVDVVVDFGA